MHCVCLPCDESVGATLSTSGTRTRRFVHPCEAKPDAIFGDHLLDHAREWSDGGCGCGRVEWRDGESGAGGELVLGLRGGWGVPISCVYGKMLPRGRGCCEEGTAEVMKRGTKKVSRLGRHMANITRSGA